ncbi:hypothetical protein [Persicirhabdus sediminis]|uniref:Uncharacterized protein n=1 Tax=Persicirhabdus sediminis TaxID=454144 RepID=A0A8J7SMS1_9BACT|nr:hypothetical protein [Persicirhabdus sediminis]MBK1792250.1 hypothetical protein [Persicirhabdus sediminis]
MSTDSNQSKKTADPILTMSEEEALDYLKKIAEQDAKNCAVQGIEMPVEALYQSHLESYRKRKASFDAMQGE